MDRYIFSYESRSSGNEPYEFTIEAKNMKEALKKWIELMDESTKDAGDLTLKIRQSLFNDTIIRC